jgi:hypothetical protein
MTLLVEPTSLMYTCPFAVDVGFFLQWAEDFLILMQSRTGEAVSCRDNACGGVFDSGYVQLAGLRAQLHADGSPIIHCIVHRCVTSQIGGGW